MMLALITYSKGAPFYNALTTVISGILLTMLTAEEISSLVRQELDHITDPALLSRIRKLLVTPYAVERDWDYGRIGERFTCWTVLEDPPSNTGIAYCDQGFGPSDPWGLVFLSGEYTGIGMDSGWFPTLESVCATAWRGMVRIQRTTKCLDLGNLSEMAGFNNYLFGYARNVGCARIPAHEV